MQRESSGSGLLHGIGEKESGERIRRALREKRSEN
jgi:hypothetical protein